MPSIASVIAVALYGLRRAQTVQSWRSAFSYAKPLGISLAVSVLLVNLVALTNKVQYGRYQTVEVKSTAFERAYGSIYRIVPAQRKRYIVFPKAVRIQLYHISSAARELAPYFEGPRAEYWRQVGCRTIYPQDCSDIVAAFFQWSLREAVAKAGHYTSATDSASFYEKLADEIDRACDQGKLRCLGPRQTLTPPFEAVFVTDALSRFPTLATAYWRAALHIVPPGPSVVIPGETATNLSQVNMFADMVGAVRPTAQEAGETRGASFKRDQAIMHVMTGIAMIYAPVLVLLILCSPVGFVLLWRRARTANDFALLALLSACAIGTIMRASLLCYLDTTAIPALNAEYATPASALLIIFAVTSTVGAGIVLIAERRHGARPG